MRRWIEPLVVSGSRAMLNSTWGAVMMKQLVVCVGPIVVVASAFGSGPLHAAPQALYGKSVVTSWTEQRMQRQLGVGEFRPATRIGGFSVYVSSAGRVFSRASMSNPRRAASGSDDQVGDTKNTTVAFNGRTMTVNQSGGSGGVRRIVVAFDDGFSSCTARVIRGKQEGVDRIIAHSLITRGQVIEITNVKTGGESCSVRNGNVFGGE